MKKKTKTKTKPVSFVAMVGFVVVVIAIGGIGTLWVKKVKENSITATRFPLTVISVKETGKKYAITGEYPIFSDELTVLNNTVEKSVKDHINEFIKIASTNWDDRVAMAQSEKEKPQEPFQCMISWEPQQMNDRYISVVVRMYQYTGGANGEDIIMTFNYDVTQKKYVTLSDLYPGQGDILTMISSYAKEDLLSQHQNEIFKGEFMRDMIDEGTKPTADNFSKFTFDDTFVTLYFPKYQVAPGVYGEQKVSVPRALTGK